MFEKPVALIRTMRPMTWISVMITIFAGMMISSGDVPPVKDVVLKSVLLPVFVLGYANSLNAYTDFRIDKITRPYRAIPSGTVGKRAVLYFAVFLFAGALIISVLVLPLFLSLFAVAGLILATAYSARPTCIKARGPAAPLAIAAGYVFIPLVGASLLYAEISFDVLLIAVVLTAQTAGASVSKDFVDLKGDFALNMDTLPLTMGVRKAWLIVFAGLLIPVVLFPLFAVVHVLPVGFLLYLVLFLWFFYIVQLTRNEKTYEKAYIHTFFFCAVSILLSGIAYVGVII